MTADEAALRREHEAGLAAFVKRERRTRFRAALDDPRRRQKLHSELPHFEDRLDPRFARLHDQHTKHAAHVDEIHAVLLKEGALATCFVVADTELDGQQAPLPKAVEALMWTGAGFLSCIPGRLGLYVSEDGSNVFVLARRP